MESIRCIDFGIFLLFCFINFRIKWNTISIVENKEIKDKVTVWNGLENHCEESMMLG